MARVWDPRANDFAGGWAEDPNTIYTQQFLSMSPPERQAWLVRNGTSPQQIGATLRSITSENSYQPMSPQELQAALQGVDPSIAQQAVGGMQGILQRQAEIDAQGSDFINDKLSNTFEGINKYQDYFVPAVGAALGAGVGAFGGGAGVGLEGAGLESAALGGGTGLPGGEVLGSGLRLGASSGGIGGGAMGSGLTPGVASTSGGYLGSGIGYSGGASIGALSPGFFAAEGGLYTPPTGVPTASSTAGGTASGATTAGAGGIVDKVLANPQLLGLGAGALLGGMGGTEQAGTTTSEEGLPDWLLPYVKPQLDQYATMLQNYNVDPYGIMPAAQQEFQKTLSGMYLDPSTNKYLQDYFNAGADRIKGTLSPSFGHMQAFGGNSGYNEALSRGLGDLATNLYGGAYERERDRMSTMTGAAPSFLGQSSQTQFAPLQNYISTISGLGRKKQEPFFNNPTGNMLGGAMAGYGLGGLFK